MSQQRTCLSHIFFSPKTWTVLVLLFALILPEGDAEAQQERRRRGKPKRVEVEKLKKQYWREGADYSVVQNRLYKKANRPEFTLLGNLIFSDPFLSIKGYGGALGYHFNEYLAVHALGWKASSGKSKALEDFEAEVNTTVNTNAPNWYAGSEVTFSAIYGKLSLLGKAILYYDLHAKAGAGMTSTQSGNNVTLHVGLGQQIYLSNNFSLKLEYRLMRYNEKIQETVSTTNAGEVIAERTNWGNVIGIGLGILLF